MIGEMCKMENEACGFESISPKMSQDKHNSPWRWVGWFPYIKPWKKNPIFLNSTDNRNHGECCQGYTCRNEMLGGVGKCIKGFFKYIFRSMLLCK